MINDMRSIYTCMAISALLFTASGTGRAQVSPAPYVPCQEMPTLIEHYRADAQSVSRFYNSSFYGTRFRGDVAVSPDRSIHCPEAAISRSPNRNRRCKAMLTSSAEMPRTRAIHRVSGRKSRKCTSSKMA